MERRAPIRSGWVTWIVLFVWRLLRFWCCRRVEAGPWSRTTQTKEDQASGPMCSPLWSSTPGWWCQSILAVFPGEPRCSLRLFLSPQLIKQLLPAEWSWYLRQWPFTLASWKITRRIQYLSLDFFIFFFFYEWKNHFSLMHIELKLMSSFRTGYSFSPNISFIQGTYQYPFFFEINWIDSQNNVILFDNFECLK